MNKDHSHTWDLHVHYYACPLCAQIVESRQNFQNHEKEISCPRCQHKWKEVQKKSRLLFGKPEKPEITWD